MATPAGIGSLYLGAFEASDAGASARCFASFSLSILFSIGRYSMGPVVCVTGISALSTQLDVVAWVKCVDLPNPQPHRALLAA